MKTVVFRSLCRPIITIDLPWDCRLELLEPRILFHGDGDDDGLPPTTDPAQMAILMAHDHHGDEWHVSASDLSPAELKILNPHFVLDERPQSDPANFANPINSVPFNPAAPAATLALPDMFPSMSGSPNIDQTTQPGRTLLRFGTQVNNMGAGPATLVSSQNDVNPDGTQNVYQRLWDYNAATNSFSFDSDRLAGRFVWHPTHMHFHYEGYASYQLMSRNPDGTVGPVATLADGSPVIGAKVGFCLINIQNTFTLPNGQSSSTLTGYTGTGQPSTGCGFLQGISVGHADVYNSSLDGQWIDVTGVPNGQYFIRISLDASNAMMESDETNNTKDFPVTLNAGGGSGGVQPDRFEPDETLATAHDFGDLGVSSATGLTIHRGPDQDWYKFNATSSGPGSVGVAVANGDVNVYLYDSAGNLLDQSTNPGTTTDTIQWNFVKGQTYYAKAVSFNDSTSSNYAFNTNIIPTVTDQSQYTKVLAGSERPDDITITRNGPTTNGLLVQLQIGGTAVPGVDYQALPSSVPIGSNASSSIISIHALPNVSRENRTITITLVNDPTYAVGSPMLTIALLGRPGVGIVPAPHAMPQAGTNSQLLPDLFSNNALPLPGEQNRQDFADLSLLQ